MLVRFLWGSHSRILTNDQPHCVLRNFFRKSCESDARQPVQPRGQVRRSAPVWPCFTEQRMSLPGPLTMVSNLGKARSRLRWKLSSRASPIDAHADDAMSPRQASQALDRLSLESRSARIPGHRTSSSNKLKRGTIPRRGHGFEPSGAPPLPQGRIRASECHNSGRTHWPTKDAHMRRQGWPKFPCRCQQRRRHMLERAMPAESLAVAVSMAMEHRVSMSLRLEGMPWRGRLRTCQSHGGAPAHAPKQVDTRPRAGIDATGDAKRAEGCGADPGDGCVRKH